MNFREKIISVILALSLAVSPIMGMLSGSVYAENAADYELSDIEVNGGGIIGFDPGVTEYEILVPYVYKTNDFTSFEMPSVTANAANSAATVDVALPDVAADGEIISVYVKDSEGTVQNTYNLTIKTVGGNLFPDGGFETDTRAAYTRGDNGYFQWDIVEDSSGAGSRLLKSHGSRDANNFYALLLYNKAIGDRTGVYLSANKTYVNGFMAKLDPESPNGETGFRPNVRSTNPTFEADANYRRKIFSDSYHTQQDGTVMENTITLTDEWGKYMAVVHGTDRDIRVGVGIGGDKYSSTEDVYTYFLYDEMYLGELVIAKAEITDESGARARVLSLPDEKTSIPLSLTVVNQYGNSVGLDEASAPVTWEMLRAPEYGVAFDSENKLLEIAADAEPGEVVLEATVTPAYAGAVQTAVKTRYKLTLMPSSDEDYLPKAKDVAASGTVGNGLQLSASYRFWSFDSTEGASSYQWYYSENENGPFTAIPGATAFSYTVEELYEGYFICIEITPKDAEGRVGTPVKSNVLRQAAAPAARNLSIIGEMSAGEVIEGIYEFYDPNGDGEGTSTYRWLCSPSEEGEYTAISGATGRTYTLTENDMNCYLKFEVTPKSLVEPFSGAPVLSKPYLCAPASVLYALSDIEVNGGGIAGFSQEKTEYDIFVPYIYRENDFKTFTMPIVGATAVKEDAQIGVRYPESMTDGAEIYVDVKDASGDVRNTYTLTIKTVGGNLFPDGGFETESRTMYKNGDYGPLTWDIVENDSGAGKYVLKANGGGDANAFYAVLMYNGTVGGQTGVYMSANKTYVNGFMAKLDPERTNTEDSFRANVRASKDETDNYKRMSFSGSFVTQEGTVAGETLTLKDEWEKYMTIASGAERDVRVGVGLGSDNHNNQTYFLYDEMYLGELVISDIIIRDQDGASEKSMPVPSGNTSVYLEATSVNQYGNALGLDASAAPVTWEMISAPEAGVTFDSANKRIDISPDAEPGTVIIEATATPKYSGAVQTAVKKRYKLTLEPVASSFAPKAKEVTASGIVKAGEVLTGDYKFWSYNSTEGASEYRWYASSNENGPFTEIPGASSVTYTVDAAYAEHYIYFEVTPRDAEGRTGNAEKSVILQKPAAPTAKKLTISGEMMVGKTLTASYEYFDTNGDAENGSTFRWLRSESRSGTYSAISGATGKTYTITEEDIDCYLKFEVTPKSSVEPAAGKAVLSEPYLSAAKALVRDLKIKDMGGRIYTASYVYSHPHNYGEGATICNWYLNDKLIETDMKVKLDEGDSGDLKLEIIPVSTANPFNGEPSYAEITIRRSGGSSGGGGGGGGGGIRLPSNTYTNASGIVPVPEKPVEVPEEETAAVDKHWASDAIDFVLENNIMQMPRENDFAGDELVTRAEFVSYIVRGLEMEEVPYKYIFKDVLGTDSFADELQAAVEAGMISEDENFYPDRPVSREEICKILLFAVGEEAVSEEDVTPEFESLADLAQISQWAVGFVRKAMKVGLMKGMGDNTFAPRGNVTRAQTAVLVMRTSEYFSSK